MKDRLGAGDGLRTEPKCGTTAGWEVSLDKPQTLSTASTVGSGASDQPGDII